MGTVRRSTNSSGSSCGRRSSRRCATGRRPTGPAHTGRTATPPSSSASARPSCAPTTTSTSATSTSRSKPDRPHRRGDPRMTETGNRSLPSWADQMRALERVGDNLMATWRPDGRDRGRDPGHEQARAVDPRRAATCAGCTPTRVARCSCRCGTTRSTRVVPTPTTSTRLPRSTPMVCTGSRDTAGTSRFVEITQQGFDMMSPADMGGGRPGTAHPRPRRGRRARRRRLLQRRAQRRTPRGSRRRLVGAGPEHPSAPDAEVLVRLEPRARRPGRDRASRRRRCRHDTRGDRAPLLRPRGVDRGHDRLRHAAGALLPRAPRGEHVPAFDEDRRDGWVAEAGLLRRHPRDRRRRGADRRDRAPGAGPLLAGAGRATTASAPSTG